MKETAKVIPIGLIGIFFLLVTACTTTLAPSYDQATVNGITETNISLMKLFATASDGTQKSTYAERQGIYNKLIGNLDALVLQSKSRPIPKNSVIEKANKHLTSRGIKKLDGENASSATALEKISETITKMKVTD